MGLTVMKARGDGKLVAVNNSTKGFSILPTGFGESFSEHQLTMGQ